jgi:predicted SnoaL-like aldol condensation-catalyzing enzyme
VLEANKELVRRHFEEIFNRKNLDACDELMAEDYIENAVAPFGQSAPGRVNGPQAMRATAEWLIAQYPDIHMAIEAMAAEGDIVAVRVLSLKARTWDLSMGACLPLESVSARDRATGIASWTASSQSTGRPARTSRPCCSSVSSSPRDDLTRSCQSRRRTRRDDRPQADCGRNRSNPSGLLPVGKLLTGLSLRRRASPLAGARLHATMAGNRFPTWSSAPSRRLASSGRAAPWP